MNHLYVATLFLVGTFSSMAIGQTTSGSASAPNDTDRMAGITRRLDRLLSSGATSWSQNDDKNRANNGSPVLVQLVKNRPVDWTKTPGDCSQLTSTVTGSGAGRTTITLVRNSDHTFNYKTDDQVSGTATDDENHHYIFLYANKMFVDSGTGFPSPKPPFDVHGTDTFDLIPVDGGAAYRTVIYFRLHINEDGSFTDQGTVHTPNVLGGPGSGRACDPI